MIRSALVVVLVASCALAKPVEPPRGRAFWVALKDSKFALPAGLARADVLKDALSLTDSEDPVLRDDVGYGLVVQWVYREQALSAAELETFTRALMKKLTGPTVLGRSFSALSLSLVAAAETRSRKLDDTTWNELLEAACVELETEKDLRGHDAKLGWIHATAHTADLLKFLARDERLTAAQQARIWKAWTARLDVPGALDWGEDERLAATARSLALRADSSIDFDAWLSSLTARWKALWATSALKRDEFAKLNATKQTLRALLVSLDAIEKPTERVTALRSKLLATLGDLG